MNDCKGIFGKWFGHKFVSLETESKCMMGDLKGSFTSELIETIISNSRDIKYEIRCKRCGGKADD